MDERSTRHSLGGAVKLVAVTREQNTYVQAMQFPLLLLAIKIWRAKKTVHNEKKVMEWKQAQWRTYFGDDSARTSVFNAFRERSGTG